MTRLLRHHWELIAAGAAMLAMFVFGGIFIAGQLAGTAAGHHPLAAATRSSHGTPLPSAPPSSPQPAAQTPPPPAVTASPGSAQPGPVAGAAPAGGGAGHSNPPPSVVYPVPVSGPAAYTTKLLASDLTLPQPLTSEFTESSAGAATLHVFYASPSTGFPPLRGCLQGSSQPACAPASLPYDGTGHMHWAIGNGTYVLRLAPYSSTQRIGFSLAWTGSHSDTLAGIRIPMSCSSYSAGCGLRFEFTTAGAGMCRVDVSTPLHLRVQQKDSTLAEIYDGTAPASFVAPYAATWTGQLFSTATQVTSVSMSISWP